MRRIFKWMRSGIRALLFFIVVTASFGVGYWLIERHSEHDLIAVMMVTVGWFAIAYVIWKSGLPCDDGREW
ncbi:hypothetical protein [Paraburkholderia humisilvae]|uniref:Uncharacterized protein n=1 Tax=Paraburkholderia humisilvae TaxID=627669 RepID=A0A6J5F393_9BURK|nr:hypothetical protein [Paraburkholderia humisilvae]CAB3772042.1 hypothetical protein LMG29542_06778 [Paraburkholderia humisilvae]